MSPELILASTSPRRKELLELAKIPFIIRKQTIDESIITTNDPAQKVEQLALHKAMHVEFLNPHEVILTADTVVAYKGIIYGKPKNHEDAFQMLSNLSGDTHEVYTGVAIQSIDKKISFVEKTTVEFWPLNEVEINEYIFTKDPFDKAGAYGIQSQGAILVKQIIGDYYNVVGLPISRVVRELMKYNIKAVPSIE
ncbi:nucleoside triphosphate pyrophosphatase [Paucisalibacillus sp. EB02]|uniref:Maf family protein n=1 Tax=Paucisalibacillus sp. EB02 TaxID=1347087 RepID=UPI0012DC6178|nr:Maf family protein [Paucisalibacillus sp. EB02]